MTNALLFKAETLAPVMADVKNNACKLWFLADEGIYLTAEKASFVNGHRTISYAEGFDPDDWKDAGLMFVAINNATGGYGEIWENVVLPPEMLECLTAGTADLAVDVTENGCVFTARVRETGVTA